MTLPTSILPCLPNANAVLELLGERRQPQFDGLAKATATMFGCPLSAITVVECDRQWFKAATDPSLTEIPTEQSICRHALVGTDLMVVEDLSKDVRFAGNPLVTEEGMRFYAGRPIWVKIAPDSEAVPVGALCMIDFAPRSFSAEERDTLEQLGTVAQTLVQAAIDAAVAEAEHAQQLYRLFYAVVCDSGEGPKAQLLADPIVRKRLDEIGKNASEEAKAILGIKAKEKRKH